MTAAVAPALALRGIDKRFGDIHALRDVSLTIAPGTIHAVLGENGAGKTTLLRVAFGLVTPNAGHVERDGRPLRLRAPRDAMAAGIGMVHQHYSLVPALTVAENVVLGARGRLRLTDAIATVDAAAETLGMSVDPIARVGDLSVGLQQRVELLKAISHGARVLILDEPTAVLAPADADALLRRLRMFVERGGTVVLITHHLREAVAHTDAVTVLRGGRQVLEAPTSSVTEATLVTAMIGEPIVSTVTTSPPRRDAIVLSARAAAWRDVQGRWRLHDATLDVHAGEIVGIAGVEGNGQSELVRLLAGRLTPHRGSVHLPDTVGFVPEDRHRDALLMPASLTENFALVSSTTARGRVSWSRLAQDTAAVIAAQDVRGATPETPAAALSGGNQQKFVVGRAIRCAPTALVVESPSRGLDVRATQAIHATLRRHRDAGAAIVVTSPDLGELLALADRIVVCFAGRVRPVDRDLDTIGRAMVGAVNA